MPITSGIAEAGVFVSRAHATAALIAPMVEVPCQWPMPLWVGLARDSRAHTSKPVMKAASNSADVAPFCSASGSSAGITGAINWPCWNVKSKSSACAATPFASAASCGDVRRLEPITVHCGAAPSPCTMSRTIAAAFSVEPASVTPMVSTNAVRARSIASGGALFKSKPVTKSAIRAESFGACPGAMVCALPVAETPVITAALPAINSRRSMEAVRCRTRMAVASQL